MADLFAACITSFLIAVITLPVIIKYFLENNLVDIPETRKIHKKITPSLGGVSIFIGFLIAAIMWMDFSSWNMTRYVIGSLFIIFLLGVRDDIVPFNVTQKLIGQIVAVIILLFSGVYIHSFYGFLGIYQIPEIAGYLLTLFVMILIINSFNLIDGLDGLAGSIAMVCLAFLGIWFLLAGDHIFSLLCFAMMGSILAFLVFNWEPSEIFMGDTGALVIGMFIGILVIRFMNFNMALPDDHTMKFSATIASGASIIIIPLSDTLRIIILRIYRGQSPFSPDKSHIHHAIMRLGMTHAKTTLILVSVNIFFILIAWIFRGVNDEWMIPVLVLLAFSLSVLLDRLIYKRTFQKTKSSRKKSGRKVDKKG